MRIFAFLLFILSAFAVSVVLALLAHNVFAFTLIEAGLSAALVFALSLVGLLLFQLRYMKTSLAAFAQAAHDHMAALQANNDDVSQDLEALSNRVADVKRDLVGHLAQHNDDGSPLLAAQPKHQTETPASMDVPLPAMSPTESIASAILSNRIDLFVQPTVTLPARKTVFYECLSRLRSEAGETLYPSSYLTHISQSKLIGTLDNFLLLRCVHIIRKLHRKAPLETFFLNVSAASLGDPEFYEQFIEFLESDSALAKHLVLELQADDLSALLPRIASGLKRLQKVGYAFAIDGAVPEDLDETLASDGFVYAKVPARLVLSHPAPSAFVRDVEALGMTLIATHVEDEKTLIDLTELNVEHAQGFLIAKPTPWDRVNAQKLLSGTA